MLASITHEINNPLQTIKNSLYLLQLDSGRNQPDWQYLEIASSETNRISNLVAQLREIYRPTKIPSTESLNLLATVKEVQELLRAQSEKGKVEWSIRAPTNEVWYVHGDKDQIKQVFINICNNAIEAMQPEGGQLEVIFSQSTQGNPEIGVLVRDTGPGISGNYLVRMFEPFQTTKTKGMGLGMAISYEIIQRHNGRLSARNYGGGAEFAVWLPSAAVTNENGGKYGEKDIDN